MSDYYSILNKNYGFKDPSSWLSYAESHDFREVPYLALDACPYCEGASYSKIGQFIYYSTLHGLLQCDNCSLCYVDVLIDSSVRGMHFEGAYKSDEYFRKERKEIFNQTIGLLSSKESDSRLILELGGATGELGVMIKNRFPNTRIIVNDISIDACKSASEKGLETRVGSILSINDLEKCSAIIALDVLYYEPKIYEAFQFMSNQLEPGGLLVIRLPNKHKLIRLFQSLKNLLSLKNSKAKQTKINFFNPEHFSILTQTFIKKALKEHGFVNISIIPAKLLNKGKWSKVSRLLYFLTLLVYRVSGKVVGTSMLVVCRRDI